ncbi:MAG TPA: DUF2177 family protein [Candidatus Saccharibacteria bacterium]|nr:DUF2177 family protein [Candidatus Saccharibacteria bacterium]
MDILLKLLIAGGVMGVIDGIWLGVIAKQLYRSELGKLLLEKPNMVAAVAFYVIYVVGILMFAVNPALEKDSWQYALGYGALFGFVAYATYDLTNLATLKDWPVKIVIIDMIWGALLTGVVSVVTFWVVQQWFS